jgi:hypothetical protein
MVGSLKGTSKNLTGRKWWRKQPVTDNPPLFPSGKNNIGNTKNEQSEVFIGSL